MQIFIWLLAAWLSFTPALADSAFVAPTANGTAAVGQLPGTTTNDSAATGKIGEYISSASGNVSVSNNTATDLTSIALTAGDWQVCGSVATNPAAGTIATFQYGWISVTSATDPGPPNSGAYLQLSATQGASQISNFFVGCKRVSAAGATTQILETKVVFSVSTMQAFGFIYAIRVR